MIKQLKEYEVMEVFSDHIDAFHLEFSYISEFILNNIELRLRKPLIVYDTFEDLLEQELKYYEEFYSSENQKYINKIIKVIRLLKEKILFQ